MTFKYMNSKNKRKAQLHEILKEDFSDIDNELEEKLWEIFDRTRKKNYFPEAS